MTNNSFSIIPSEHELKKYLDTGLFYCVICNKAEVELSEPCVKQNGEKDE